ncbi:hypothetical protein [Luteimicrobium album]|uniref:hypothetical protein n=1 Tax=Luteimicrobium album TaxID=1054550 RepID=UPI0024E19824|nr:hypothetical protein [Luteimicrobium album]
MSATLPASGLHANVALGYTANRPVSDPAAFVERVLPVPEPGPGRWWWPSRPSP